MNMAGAPPPPPPSAPPPPPGQGPEDREEARFNTKMLAILGSFIIAAIVLWALFGRNLSSGSQQTATSTPVVTVLQLPSPPAAPAPPAATSPPQVITQPPQPPQPPRVVEVTSPPAPTTAPSATTPPTETRAPSPSPSGTPSPSPIATRPASAASGPGGQTQPTSSAR